MWPEETKYSTLKMLLLMPHSFSECVCVCFCVCVLGGSDEKENSMYISAHFAPHIKTAQYDSDTHTFLIRTQFSCYQVVQSLG